MKTKFLVIVSIIGLLSCNSEVSEKEQLTQNITKLENQLRKNDQLNESVANQVIQAYKEYADKFPNDSIAPDYLFKAGEVSIGLRQYTSAISFLERLNEHHPKYAKAPECFFLIAFVYDAYLSRKGKAKEMYEKFIEQYPDHHFADDAKASIEHMNMSDEDLIKMFQEKALEQGAGSTN
ncbi:MAG: hypothetical protein COA57_11320 [Flavobacteriales bacterium]|nr:MAG: hypothetical protein COA57_11320 [Flavobacteriales bacterium]